MRTHWIKQLRWITPLLLLAALIACAPAGHEAGHKTDVDLNKKFLDPDLDVPKWVERFESEERDVFANRNAIVAALNIRPGMAVADVGAGTGAFMPLIAGAVGAEGRYYAVDISPKFIEHLRNRAGKEGLENVTVVLGAFESITLPPNSVNRVFVCNTYHHFANPKAVLRSIHTALRPGGELVVVDFDRKPGESKQWLLKHVDISKQEYQEEITSAGYTFLEEVKVEGLKENFVLRFAKREAGNGNN